MKLKTLYVCQNCAYQSTKWAGKCLECGSWNSLAEETVNVGKPDKTANVVRSTTPQKVHNFSSVGDPKKRIVTGIGEFDAVAGGGIVEGSLILLSGEPGIGKSTLTMQILEKVAAQKERVLYVTGEESIEQVSDRAKRLGLVRENMSLLYESNIENIMMTVKNEKPNFLVIDSIQVMYSSEIESTAGTMTQIRFVTEAIMVLAKSMGIPTLLIGHVTKEGEIAGPKVLEHLVDAVLLLEGERDHDLRLLRALKNRFGTVNEVGIFEMSEKGLDEMKNPAQRILESRPKNAIGSCLTMTMEGNRPILMEVQALCSTTAFGYPKRMASGFDRNRLELLIAVIQKHTKLNLADQDIFINITGGLQLRDPGADTAICMAIASSLLKKALNEEIVAFGEVGLTGEIRKSSRETEREKAVKKLGLNVAKKRSVAELLII
jgi:DNA repair protein RadA/Sms